ncbi:MAG: response regulator transcription factor [Frankiaceae bacterium]|nr:response regulator transcription factor [Frankiaceae bacterium]MBV9369522.1 response regulator transcription factor [Frankiales bacterium]
MTTVLICDDHRMIREGLRRSVQALPGVDRVDTAESGEEVLARWPAERQDLVLMDVSLPGIGGLEATRRLVRAYPDAHIVMLAGVGAGDRDAVAMAISGGARGYLQKNVSREELCAAVATALAEQALDSGVGFGAGFGAPRQRTPDAPDAPALTERELQVLHGMSQGRSNAEIGRELYLSEDTIKTHARRLFRKMGVNDRAQAVAAGFRWGLVR